MADRRIINAIATLERGAALSNLEALLRSQTSEAGGLESYAERFPGTPLVSPAGDLSDSLRRVRDDVGARGSTEYALSVMMSAASEILERQERRIAELEERLALGQATAEL